MNQPVREFYDAFFERQLRDYTDGNRRVDRQLELLRAGVPRGARRILVVGCGVGEIAKHLISGVAREARVVALDLSGRSIEAAAALFPHDRIEFRHADILEHDFEHERYDVVVLPDVYEHVPISDRPALHGRLKALLSGDGRILVTIPSPARQQQVRSGGADRQIVDELVTLEDLIRLAAEVDGELTYFAVISVWAENDYAHAVIERNPPAMAPLSRGPRPPLKSGRRSGLRRLLEPVLRRLFVRPFRRWRVRRRLRGFDPAGAATTRP